MTADEPGRGEGEDGDEDAHPADAPEADEGWTGVNPFPTDDYEFGLCLTHDVDRPYKGVQSLFYALTERDPSHLRDLPPGHNPWWQFDAITELESTLGVRSAFYFLAEQHLLLDRPVAEWFDPTYWIEHVSRYDPSSPPIATVMRRLDEEGWEVGLHGSLGTYRDPDRFTAEKLLVESALGHELVGGRHHHLRFDPPDTWRLHADAGLRYDTSLGSSERVGFHYGYDLRRPFDDAFVVFPLTVMDTALFPVEDDVAAARQRVYDLLEEAREHSAVMTVLWHPRNFSTDYPGQRAVYRDLIARAQELGAWVGPPADLYEEFSLGDPATPDATVVDQD